MVARKYVAGDERTAWSIISRNAASVEVHASAWLSSSGTDSARRIVRKVLHNTQDDDRIVGGRCGVMEKILVRTWHGSWSRRINSET